MSTWTASRTPEPPHPFANWIANDEWVIISGMVGVGPDGVAPDSVVEQTRLAIGNAEMLLKQAGSGLHEVVLITPHVTDRSYAFEMDSVFREMLPDPKPASGAMTVVVGLAAPEFKVELDLWASRGAKLVAA